jgi:hypothetical protein
VGVTGPEDELLGTVAVELGVVLDAGVDGAGCDGAAGCVEVVEVEVCVGEAGVVDCVAGVVVVDPDVLVVVPDDPLVLTGDDGWVDGGVAGAGGEDAPDAADPDGAPAVELGAFDAPGGAGVEPVCEEPGCTPEGADGVVLRAEPECEPFGPRLTAVRDCRPALLAPVAARGTSGDGAAGDAGAGATGMTGGGVGVTSATAGALTSAPASAETAGPLGNGAGDRTPRGRATSE